jgi:uncharacterized protein (TIGR00251 family)
MRSVETARIVQDGEGVRVKVFVKPRARKNAVVGIQGDAIKIHVASPPVEGAANRDLREFLAKTIGIAPSRVEIVSGHTSRHKTVRIMGVTPEEVHVALLSGGAGKQKDP